LTVNQREGQTDTEQRPVLRAMYSVAQ